MFIDEEAEVDDEDDEDEEDGEDGVGTSIVAYWSPCYLT
jgi:hypothetical protein